jgi:hypothetical protein
MRGKLVEKRLDDGGTGEFDRCQKIVLNALGVVEDGAVTVK